MEIIQYCSVLLKNGKEAAIVEILSEDTFFVDVDIAPGEWENIVIKLDEIEKVLWVPDK